MKQAASNIVSIILCYMIFLSAINFMELMDSGRSVLAIVNLPMAIIGFSLLASKLKREERQKGE